VKGLAAGQAGVYAGDWERLWRGIVMARKKTSKAEATNPAACEGVVVPVPAKLRKQLGEIVKIVDDFCERHLDEEFKGLCRDMAAALFLAGLPLGSGKAAGWAAGIVYSVGWVNFLGDPSQPHHMKAEDMAKAIGASPATLMNRARNIREGVGLRRVDERWSTKAMLQRNPFVRMFLPGEETDANEEGVR
jgi:hypothetical protein